MINEFFVLYSTGSPWFYYFPKLGKFLISYLDDENLDITDLYTYDEIIKNEKDEWFTIKPENNSANKLHNQYVRAYIAADKNLGYYRLSPKPTE